MEIAKIKQRLEILWKEVEKLEASGGGSGGDSYTKAETDTLLSAKADKSSTYTKTETDAEIQGAITDLDVPSTSVTGHVIRSIAQTDGKIAAEAELVDTTPTLSSTKLCTSGGIYDAIQAAAGGGGIETVELVRSGNSSYWPEDKMSVLDSYNQFIYLKTFSTQSDLCFIVHDINSPNAKVGFVLKPVTYNSTRVSHVSYTGFSVNTTTRLVTYGDQIDNVDVNNVLTSFYTPIGTAINANTNLDGSTVCTKYYCTAANATTLTNCPTTDAFVLTVEHTTSTAANTMLQKIITVGTTPTVYIRTKSGSSTWNSWYKFEGTAVS